MRRAFPVILALVSVAITLARANTFVVQTAVDGDPGSLRQAILQANANPGLDTIVFGISDPGVQTITPTSDLPAIEDPVLIDGYTQPGASPNTLANGDDAVLLVEIDGADDGNVASGLTITSDGAGSTIRGLVINRVGKGAAITLSSTSNCIIRGCFIGTDASGTIARRNHYNGISAIGGAGNLIGGTTPAARNIISGNILGGNTGEAAIEIGDDDDVVQGNFIGVDATGTVVLPNGTCCGGEGVQIDAGVSGNLIGGVAVGARNIISGNHLYAIYILGASASTIQGNFIGTDVTGTKALGNGGGIIILGVSSSTPGNNLIGGTATGARNIISANGVSGLRIYHDSNDVVQGNLIGTDITGTQPLGNGDIGVDLSDANNVTVGGTSAGAGNVIAFNGVVYPGYGWGVSVHSGTGNAILGNSIFSNSSLGINLNFDGVTLNDAGDADTGPNNLQNFPVITAVTSGGGMTNISARLNGAPNTTYHIEFFANDSIDSSGYGEGQTLILTRDAITDASGNVSFSSSLAQIGAGQRVTATATDPNNNTSEFSGAIGQLLNASTRMQVQTGNNVLIGGFIVSGSGSTDVLLRALGPTLSQFGVTGALGNPTLDLFSGNTLLASNDNWKDTQQAGIAATGLAPPNDLESAILHTFSAGSYTAVVRGKNQTTGVGLVEVYDIDKILETTLTNISTRGVVGTGQNVMIGGLISGNGIVRVIARALGPTLSQFGVPNVLADPTLELHDANGTVIASNDNWQDSQQAEIQASGFAPPNANESAIIIVRPAANTTAVVRGNNNTTGNALVEAYVLSP